MEPSAMQQTMANANLTDLLPTSRQHACWVIQSCGGCLRSDHGCGWCPNSATCVPATNLLEPVTNKNICPLESERFELRVKALGCGCSTTTLLSIIVTVFATVAALVLLYGLGLLIKLLNQAFGSGQWQGWEIEVKEDGTRQEREWRRSNAVTSFFRRMFLKATKESEQEQVTERSRLLG